MFALKAISLTIFLVVGALAFAVANVEERILDPTPAREGQFPFVAVVIRDADTWSSYPCPAAIIDNRHVVTIALCGLKFKPNIANTTVSVGSLKIGEGISYGVGNVIIHPNFEPQRLLNNIAIVRTNETIEFTPNVQAVRLPIADLNASGGQTVTTMGWGSTTNSHASPARTLQYRTRQTFSRQHCSQDGWGGQAFLVKNTICTKLQTCYYDSSNPVVDQENRLVGMISLDNRFGCREPDVAIRIFPYVNWIRQNTINRNIERPRNIRNHFLSTIADSF